MKHAKNPPAPPFHYDWLSGKCFDGACPIGTWMVPAADPRPGEALGRRTSHGRSRFLKRQD